jgi:hypothetical protein
VAEWLREGVVERCPRSSAWNMNLVVVKKPSDPNVPPKFRVCIDPRPINRVTPVVHRGSPLCGAVRDGVT